MVEGLTRDSITVSATAEQFYAVGPENYNPQTQRMWWMRDPTRPDPFSHIMEKLIRLRDMNNVKDALAFTELTQKFENNTTWRCRSCKHCYQWCYEMRELVDRTTKNRPREDEETEEDAATLKRRSLRSEEDAVQNARVATADPLHVTDGRWQNEGNVPTEQLTPSRRQSSSI